MIGSIIKSSLALAAISWSSYSPISTAIDNHNTPPPSPSNFFEISASNITSSYEELGEKLPKWATKKINFSVPKELDICFTHVG